MITKNDAVVKDKSGPSEQDAKYFLAAIVESSQDSIVTIDLNRVITSWNKAAEDLYGYKSDEVIGNHLEMVMLPKDIVDLIEKVEKISHEISVPIYETVRLHKNGKEADLQIALSPVRNLSGEVIGISTIARDITVAKLQEQLKDEFIVVASHELKTPVTSIKGYAQILVARFKDLPDAKSFSMLTKLDRQIDRLIELINTLLDTTKLAAGDFLLNIQSFDLSSLIEEQIEVIQRVSPNHQIIFEGEKSRIVLADRKLIGQAILNFISNAVKYSPGGQKVIVSLTETTHAYGVKVSVQDFGVGIPTGLNHKIFERYFRVNDPRGASISGMGLGLYITAHIIHQHGGKLNVDSKEGMGSTFSFELPQKITAKSPAEIR
jgi:two-component system sensor histidine kinase VicK